MRNKTGKMEDDFLTWHIPLCLMEYRREEYANKKKKWLLFCGKAKKEKTTKKKSQNGGAEQNAENGHRTVTIKGYLQVGVGIVVSIHAPAWGATTMPISPRR